MMKRKWTFYPALASAGFVLPVALVSVANAETPEQNAASAASETATEAASSAQKRARDAAASAEQVTEDAAEATEGAATSAADATEDAASSAADAGEKTAAQAAGSASGMASDAADSAGSAGSTGDTKTPDVAAPAQPAGMREYVVQEGDTLGDIAREHLGSVEAWPRIARLNGIENPAELSVGTRLKLPQN
jgi:nucleoid-associated protein YgaU